MVVDASTTNYKIVTSNRYRIPEDEMPLKVELKDQGASFYVLFETIQDETKDKNIIEDKVTSDGISFIFVNWELGKGTSNISPVPFAQFGNKSIFIFNGFEKTRNGVFCIDLMILERK